MASPHSCACRTGMPWQSACGLRYASSKRSCRRLGRGLWTPASGASGSRWACEGNQDQAQQPQPAGAWGSVATKAQRANARVSAAHNCWPRPRIHYNLYTYKL